MYNIMLNFKKYELHDKKKNGNEKLRMLFCVREWVLGR